MRTLDISNKKPDKDNISDLKVYGDGDTFRLLSKASSDKEGFAKSTKVCNVGIDINSVPRKLIPKY